MKSKFMQALEKAAPHLKENRERERKQKQNMYKWLIAIYGIGFLFSSGLFMLVCYVIYHFISKYW